MESNKPDPFQKSALPSPETHRMPLPTVCCAVCGVNRPASPWLQEDPKFYSYRDKDLCDRCLLGCVAQDLALLLKNNDLLLTPSLTVPQKSPLPNPPSPCSKCGLAGVNLYYFDGKVYCYRCIPAVLSDAVERITKDVQPMKSDPPTQTFYQQYEAGTVPKLAGDEPHQVDPRSTDWFVRENQRLEAVNKDLYRMLQDLKDRYQAIRKSLISIESIAKYSKGSADPIEPKEI